MAYTNATNFNTNSSSVCSRRHCLRDCHRTRLSDSSLLFVRFEVSVYYYIIIIITENNTDQVTPYFHSKCKAFFKKIKK